MKVNQLYSVWRHFGADWLMYRASYAARMRLGIMRKKLPAASWEAQPLESFLSVTELADPESYLAYRRTEAPEFFFKSSSREAYQNYFAAWDDAATVTPLDLSRGFARGELRYFEHTTAPSGFPPDWHRNPFTGKCAPANIHWSEIDDFAYGDIKIIWEPSRFAFAYALVRAYWRTGDDRYGELFWQAFEDWRENNPPQLGANWRCGQETAFRVMAWCFALYGFVDSRATTGARVANLAQAIAVSGKRIESNLDYALSQQNNHGISEGLGLWTIGALFPEFRFGEHWQAIGREVLESEARELIYTDGAFAQHSVNYHRLMLHDYLWAIRLGEILQEPFSSELKERIRAASNFLYQIQDGESGHAPNYGHNDGALVLPLNNCDYQDFRPVIQATHYLTERTRVYPSGAWDEDLLWLFGAESLGAAVQHQAQEDFKAEAGGYYVLRSDEGFVLTRAAAFHHRPSQADLLHIDLWWRGQNIASDAGTFSYNAPAPWDHALAHTAYHNTVTVDGRDQMERIGKFMWLPWARGEALRFRRSPAGRLAYFEGTHEGYERLNPPVAYRRAVVQLGECWLVLDDLLSAAEHQYRLHWLLIDAPYEWDETKTTLDLNTSRGSYYLQTRTLNGDGAYSIVRADAESARGWRAPYYQAREPALSFALTTWARAARFLTLFSPSRCSLTCSESSLRLDGETWRATLTLCSETPSANKSERKPLIAALNLSGTMGDAAVDDNWEID